MSKVPTADLIAFFALVMQDLMEMFRFFLLSGFLLYWISISVGIFVVVFSTGLLFIKGFDIVYAKQISLYAGVYIFFLEKLLLLAFSSSILIKEH